MAVQQLGRDQARTLTDIIRSVSNVGGGITTASTKSNKPTPSASQEFFLPGQGPMAFSEFAQIAEPQYVEDNVRGKPSDFAGGLTEKILKTGQAIGQSVAKNYPGVTLAPTGQNFVRPNITPMSVFERSQMEADERDGIDDQLRRISESLGERKKIKPMTEAERIEMEQDEGFENIFQQPSGGATIDGAASTGTGTTTDGGSESSNANQAAQVGAAGTDAGTGDAGGKTDEPYNPYGALLESAMKDVAALQGKDPNALTKEDYMKEFAEATGVNISGEPDKSHALMAFGLALMQNKAGKGFDVSKMLGAVGEAGEKAMPAFQKAKEVARAERIAAGKYALSERKAAAASRLSQLNAAQERVQDLLTKTSDHVSKQLLNQQEHELDMAKVKLENIGKVDAAKAKAGGKQFDVTAAGTYAPLTSMPNIKINTAVRKSDGQEVFTKPLQDVELLAKGYADTLDGISSVDNISTLIDDAAKASAAGVTGQRFFEFIDGRMKALGFEEGLGVGITVDGKKLGPLAEADAIRKRLIFQYKRFLTQETGNGISNVDIQNLEAAIGNIDFFTNPQEALVKLRETRKLFEMSRDTLQRQLVRFSDKDLYLAPSQFDKVQQKINSAALSGVGMGRGNLDVSETDDGVTVIKLS